MIEIVYNTSKEHIFDLTYKQKDYIPELFYKLYPQNTELHFMKSLFAMDPTIQFIGENLMIWSTHYKFKFKDTGFILVLDEDYDLISYAVDNPTDRIEIAEYIYNILANRKL